MKILVTGGSGFIGSNFISYLAEKYPDFEIINFSRGRHQSKNLEHNSYNVHGKNIVNVKGDLLDKPLVNQVIDGVDVVFHFAGESHVAKSNDSPEEFVKSNIIGTQILLDLLKDKKINKFIYLSSSEIYGGFDKIFNDEVRYVKETDAPLPDNLYAATKIASEFIAKYYYASYKIPLIILRACNAFGTGQYPEKVIPKFITALLKNQKIQLYQKGGDFRTYIYVNDLCEALDLVFKNGKLGEIYNIGTSDRISNLELARKILNKLGKGDDFIEFLPSELKVKEKFSLDLNKIQSLGWRQKTSFDDALDKTISWYKENKGL